MWPLLIGSVAASCGLASVAIGALSVFTRIDVMQVGNNRSSAIYFNGLSGLRAKAL
jgi:hypothetical protein